MVYLVFLMQESSDVFVVFIEIIFSHGAILKYFGKFKF